MRRYQWRALPRGMTNSPTLCQKYVAKTIQQSESLGKACILSVTWVMLIAGQASGQGLQCLTQLKQALTASGLQIAPEKVQLQEPYTYLEFQMNGPKIINQKATICRDQLYTLNDFQKLLLFKTYHQRIKTLV